MKALIDFLKLIPRPMQIAIAGMVLGGAAFAGHEIRYMTVADYTKSYILELKSEIRELERELRRSDIDPGYRQVLAEQLERMIDELCYELPDDPYCRDRN